MSSSHSNTSVGQATDDGMNARPRWHDPRETPLDVRWDWHGYWRVSGPEGDYGLAETRAQAISIALDAVVTGGPLDEQGYATRRIDVYDHDNWRTMHDCARQTPTPERAILSGVHMTENSDLLEPGDLVRDTITGMEGIVIARSMAVSASRSSHGN